MDDYVTRFRAMVDELRARPDVVITRFHVAPPVSDEEIRDVQQAIGRDLPEEILGFYRQANGISLQWFPKDGEGYEEGAEEADELFDWVPEDGYGSGVVNIYPLERLKEDHADEFWFDHIPDDAPPEFDHDRFAGQDFSDLAFHKSLRAIDYFDSYRVAALALIDEPVPRVVFGDDHGADFITFPPASFGSYLETVLAVRGSYRQRVRRFFSYGAKPDQPIPSLDEIVAELAMPQEEWEELLESEYDEEDDFDYDGTDYDEEED